MARRRVTVVFVLLAACATAWLLFRADKERGPRATLPPVPAFVAKGKKPLAAGEAQGTPAPETPPIPASGPSPLLRVRVVDEGRAPVAGARVEATFQSPAAAYPLPPAPQPGTPLGKPDATAITNADGSAALAVDFGPHWVRASRGDAASMPLVLMAGDGEAVLVLEPARALRAVVLRADGSPAVGFLVHLTFSHGGRTAPFSGQTNGAGAFDVPALPDSWLEALSVRVDDPFLLLAEPMKAPPRRTLPRWQFEFGREELSRGAITLDLTAVPLRGRVVGEDGVPLGRVTVHWAAPGAPGPTSFRFVAMTTEDGTFEAEVQRTAGEAFVLRTIGERGLAPLVWRPDASSGQEIVLRRGMPLAGRVTDPEGTPVGRAFVRLESPRLPGRVMDERQADEEGRFRFDVADEEITLYAFRPVEPDLCLPQHRVDGIRGGPDEVRVVLPAAIRGWVQFVAHGTGKPVTVEHLTLILKDVRGAEIAKRSWAPHEILERARFEVWGEGTYDLEVFTAHHEPARLPGVAVVRGRGLEVAVPLVPRR